jgi:NAD(P)-dependent dehydrogenase (short-subunit alcohol dehydrogenase family)
MSRSSRSTAWTLSFVSRCHSDRLLLLTSSTVNAGTLSPLGKTSSMVGKLDEYESLFKINFFSLVSILGHSLPHLRTAKEGSEAGIHGRVVLVSSGASTGGVSGWGAYR